MVGRAKSDTKKRQVLCEVEEDWRLRAIEAYRTELCKPDSKHKGSVACDFMHLYKIETGQDIKIDHNLLIHGAKGGRTRAQANAARSWLTTEEQEVVIKYIAECGNRGFLLSHHRLKEHVNEILRTQLGDKFPIGGVGKKWTNRFIEKYSEQIKMFWLSLLDSNRGRAVNEHTAKAWFDLVEEVTTKYKIRPESTYGADEIGTNPADGERE